MSNENSKNSLVSEPVPTWKMISYGFASSLSAIVISTYALVVFYFYEVEVGLATVLVGISFIIFALWNMVNDPLLGYLTDKPRGWTKKWGVRRPWIISTGFLTIVFFFLMFTPPNVDAKNDPWPIFWYMVIITCLFDTFYTIYNAHYMGGFASQFREQNVRRKSSAISRVVGTVGGFVGMAIVVPFTVVYGDRSSYVRMGLILSIVMIIFMFLLMPGIKENDLIIERYMQGFEERKNYNFWKVLNSAFHSKNYLLGLFAYTMFLIVVNIGSANMFYFIKDVLGLGPEVMAPIFLAYFIVMFASIPIWVKISKKIGSAKVLQIGMICSGVGSLSYLIIADLTALIIVIIITTFFRGAFLSMYLVIVADSYDEVTLNCGCHQEATLLGISNFFVRVTYLVVGVIIATVHIMTGYNTNPAATQTPLALLGIRLISSVFPAIFSILGGVAVALWYDLKGEKLKEMKAKLKECGL